MMFQILVTWNIQILKGSNSIKEPLEHLNFKTSQMCTSESSETSQMCTSESSEKFITSEDYFEERLTLSLNEVFQGCVPIFVDENREWLWKIGEEFLCCLCDKYIETSSSYWVNRDTFDKHLNSEGHINHKEDAFESRNPPDNTYKIYESDTRDILKVLYGSDEDIPVSYTHLDVYKRQVFCIY